MEKICQQCCNTKTTKWYAGPMCRQCYRKQPHIKQKELATAKICNAKYRKNNKQKCNEISNKWKKNNIEYFIKYQAIYRLANKEKKRYLENQYRLSDPEKRLAIVLRNRLRMALKRHTKTGSAVRDLGCSIEEFKKYIESKFQVGMSWNNHGISGWHIDHIRPLSSFNLSNREELLIACHYTNLQPLWAKDNLAKGDSV